jgi:glycosyltransferase involved in cell wall biosynthesis
MYQITWQGIVHDQQGYARASREYILALDRAGVDIRIEPLNFGTPSTNLIAEQAKRLKELIAKPKAKDKKHILVYHAQPYGVNAIKEREVNGYDKVIINTVWETTLVPNDWFPYINYADAVIVPSTQNVQALKDSGVTVPIILAPHGADVETFSPENGAFEIPEINDKFKFLSIFQWQHRKGPDKLLKAYWREFTKEDNVALVVKSYWGNHGLKSDQRIVMNTISRYKANLGFGNEAPTVYFSGSLFNENDLRGLYTMADVFVLPSRGEGVGLPYMEAMASGIPCIATGWGGQTDFITNENGYLIDYTLETTTSRNHEAIAQNFFHLFTDDMKWAEADVEHLQKLMRHAYENQEEVKAKGQQARKDMEALTWTDIGILLKESIEKVVL